MVGPGWGEDSYPHPYPGKEAGAGLNMPMGLGK